MLHKHQVINHTKPRLQSCNYCHRPLVLIDYHESLLKGCVTCNLWGRPGGRAWTHFLAPVHALPHLIFSQVLADHGWANTWSASLQLPPYALEQSEQQYQRRQPGSDGSGNR